jgi:DNA-damage-inducible protein D
MASKKQHWKQEASNAGVQETYNTYYSLWQNFNKVIDKAKIACQKANQKVEDHFPDVRKMVKLGSGAERQVEDILLTRYACHLIAQNGDPRKEQIAFAQTYFAVQTRKAELIEQRLMEIERVKARTKLQETEKHLSGILYERGIDSKGFAIIRSKGDQFQICHILQIINSLLFYDFAIHFI